MSAEADGKLESVWVRAHRFPTFARKVEVAMEIGYLVGDHEEVDLNTLNRHGPVRIKIACVEANNIRGESRVFLMGKVTILSGRWKGLPKIRVKTLLRLIDRGIGKLRMRRKRRENLMGIRILELLLEKRVVGIPQEIIGGKRLVGISIVSIIRMWKQDRKKVLG
jgi:hypothetical protein